MANLAGYFQMFLWLFQVTMKPSIIWREGFHLQHAKAFFLKSGTAEVEAMGSGGYGLG